MTRRLEKINFNADKSFQVLDKKSKELYIRRHMNIKYSCNKDNIT